MHTTPPIFSLILAAGRGSRMQGYDGNKTLLPLVPDTSAFEGTVPILRHIVDTLPEGPKAVVVNYRKETVMEATADLGLSYCEQPALNGTGGALLAARPLLERLPTDRLIITMGDVPLVRRDTYLRLVGALDRHDLAVLGFRPLHKKRYGVLDVEGSLVRSIIEWTYWKDFTEQDRRRLDICNAGIYAVRTDVLPPALEALASRPHRVRKTIDGVEQEVEEFFITDMVEYVREDGRTVGCVTARDEYEVMGVDDARALETAQARYRDRHP